MKPNRRSLYRQLLAVLMLALTSMSCTWSLIDIGKLQPSTPAPGGGGPTATPIALADTTFNVRLSAPLAAGENVYLAVLDEVTGLSFNALQYPMQQVEATLYSLKLPVPLGSVVKYRYVRQGGVPAQEYNGQSLPVRYRVVTVSTPMTVDDIVATWAGQAFSGIPGSISGTVVDAQSRRPVPGIMVSAAGVSTLTDSLGQYVLNGLPQGTHLLSAYALDGTYQSFQQGAVVASGLTTDATLEMKSAAMVQVTFVVSLPSSTVTGAPVRLAGNLLQLGNTFADLNGGLSTVASRMPVLSSMPDGRQTLTLKLPAGADIRYKYTLGDGFWNAEHGPDDVFVLRQLIVPNKDTVVNDVVSTWQSGQSAPILFEVTVPSNTPVGDIVSIQFNPYGWTQPLPMWPLGNNKWVYKLFSPLDMLGSFGYRYCRNEQCGSADDVATIGATGSGRSVSTSMLSESVKDTVRAWNWWPETDPTTLVTVNVNKREGGFWGGVEFQAGYNPTWQSQVSPAAQTAQGLGANLVVFSPTWTARSLASGQLNFAPQPGFDPLWQDNVLAIQSARAANLNVAVYAVPRLLPSTPDFWNTSSRSADWWNTWFARYRAFVLTHADLAAQAGAQALIIGGDTILPALPGGKLANGSPSNVPADAETRWRAILAEARTRFSGRILWAHPYQSSITVAPAFVDQVNDIYLLWSAPLAVNGAASVDVMSREAGRRMDEELLPFLAAIRKNVVIAVDYPSAGGVATGCVPSGGGGCIDWLALSRPYPDVSVVTLDLQGQANLYQSMLMAINERAWISGFVSRGFYVPVALMDKSSSVRGKPTSDYLWYWLPRLTGRQ